MAESKIPWTTRIPGGSMKTYLTTEQDKIIETCVANWTTEKSITRACEELNELSIALLKLLRADEHTTTYLKRIDDIKSEMADVHIVLKHLEVKFGTYGYELELKIKKAEAQ